MPPKRWYFWSEIRTLAKTLAERRTHYQEFRIIWPDSSVHWIAGQGEPFYDEAGQLVRMIGVVMDITERKRAEEVLRQSREQLRRLAARMDSLREKERTWIAREVHDQLGQVFTSIKLDLSLMKKALARSEYTAEELRSLLHEKIECMVDSADAAIRTVQKIGTELRPAVLDDLGLLAAIEWQTKNFESRTGIRCRIKTDLQAVDIDPRCATAVFRIFQETLTNVARHAKATRMNIQIEKKSGQLLLNVEDNGRGISHLEIHNPASLGLLGMRERALLFNGEIHFSGISGKGTTVSLRMPLSKRKIHRKGDLSGPPK